MNYHSLTMFLCGFVKRIEIIIHIGRIKNVFMSAIKNGQKNRKNSAHNTIKKDYENGDYIPEDLKVFLDSCLAIFLTCTLQ